MTEKRERVVLIAFAMLCIPALGWLVYQDVSNREFMKEVLYHQGFTSGHSTGFASGMSSGFMSGYEQGKRAYGTRNPLNKHSIDYEEPL